MSQGRFYCHLLHPPAHKVLLQEKDDNRNVPVSSHYLMPAGACSQGQSLEVIDNIYFCDGKPLGKALEKDMNGNKMEKFINNFVITHQKFS